VVSCHIAGAGKTILSYVHISWKWKRQVCKPVHWHIYRSIIINHLETEQSVLNLITSLLKQLVQDYTAINEVLSMLGPEAQRFSKVFIVVDALDECPEVDGTRARLLAALQTLQGTFNLLVTSRDLASIAEDFCETKRLDIYASDDDVRKFIQNRIPREPRLARHIHGHPTHIYLPGLRPPSTALMFAKSFNVYPRK